MDTDAGSAWIPVLIALVVIIIVGRFLLFPAICRAVPLQVPAPGFDLCVFFR
jgi:hypothetical protein